MPRDKNHAEDATIAGPAAQDRAWHRAFTDVALYHLAVNQGAVLRTLLEQRHQDLPALILARLGEQAALDEPRLRRHASEVAVIRAAFAAHCWIVRMPEAQSVGEAHFVGLLLAGDAAHYFTLELAEGGASVLCLRDPVQGRLELEELATPTLAAFEAAIARECAPARRADGSAGANAGRAAARPQAPASDVIDRENLSREHLLAILDAALLDACLHGERSIVVNESGVRCVVSVAEGRTDHLTLSACWDLNPAVPRDVMLERVNDINNGYLAVRATLVGRADLLLELQLLLPAALSRKYFVLALRRFATISREAVDATCKDILA